MALIDIVYYGDPKLEKVSEPISEVTPEIRKLVAGHVRNDVLHQRGWTIGSSNRRQPKIC